MKNVLYSLFLPVAALAFTTGSTLAQPNIVVVLTDDQGYGEMGRHGHPFLETPNMDRLHDESVRLTDFSVSPTCAPTRAALMTGMQELNSGVTHTLMPRRLMNREITTLPQVLSDAGYATAHFGKWHLGQSEGYRPDQRGFDSSLTVPDDNQRSHYDPELLRNGEIISSKGYRTDIFFDEAMRWIEEQGNGDEPFFCYLATYNAHGPLVVPEKYAMPYEDQGEKLANYYGMLGNLDWNLGRLLDRLDTLDLSKDTLIVFMNDNGGTFGVDTYNAGMRGCKGTIWRGGTRAFSFWRWPQIFEPRNEDTLTGHVDVLPTLAEIGGTKLSEQLKNRIEGVSFAGLLADPNSELPDRMLFQHSSRWENGFVDAHRYVNCGIRWRKWHLLQSGTCSLGCDGECKVFRKAVAEDRLLYTEYPNINYAQTPRGKWMLYNLESDPSQDREVGADHPEIVQQMASAYEQWWKKVRPLLINEVGYSE